MDGCQVGIKKKRKEKKKPYDEELLEDPGYKGLRRERLKGDAYDALVEEFMSEMRSWQPRCLVQFEDFGRFTV